MISWDNYYERSPYLEGITSTFDVLGENSSFHSPVERQRKNHQLKHNMEMYFREVGKYLQQAMNYYDKTQKDKKL